MITKNDLLLDAIKPQVEAILSDEYSDPILRDVIDDLVSEFVLKFDTEKLEELKSQYKQELENKSVWEEQTKQKFPGLLTFPI